VSDLTILFGHSWERDFAKVFEGYLQHIRTSGCNVLDAEQLHHHLSTQSSFPARSVLITLDDAALQDIVAFELLEKYDLPAISFAIPSPHVSTRYYQQPENWKLWKTFERNSRLSVECHSLTHSKVFLSGRIVDYVWEEMDPVNTECFDYRPGAPIYESGPALVNTKYFPSPDLHDRCVEYYEKINGQNLSPGECLAAMNRFVADNAQCKTYEHAKRLMPIVAAGRQESGGEHSRRIVKQLAASKRLLEQRLKKTIRYFSYPFGAYSPELAQLLAVWGYEAAFTTDPAKFNINSDPFYIGRCEMNKYLPSQII